MQRANILIRVLKLIALTLKLISITLGFCRGDALREILWEMPNLLVCLSSLDIFPVTLCNFLQINIFKGVSVLRYKKNQKTKQKTTTLGLIISTSLNNPKTKIFHNIVTPLQMCIISQHYNRENISKCSFLLSSVFKPYLNFFLQCWMTLFLPCLL